MENGVRSIGDYAFRSCSKLTSITIPASVTSLGGYVFGYCSSLTKVYYLGDAPAASLELYRRENYYSNTQNLTSYVLKGTRGWDGIESSRALPEKWPSGNYGCPITYWEANTFDLVFDGNGGTPATNVVEQTTDATYVLPATDPEREGWEFDGWWTERSAGARVTESVLVKAVDTHTLYAHWTLLGIPAKVRFFIDGVETEQDFTVGTMYGSLPSPTKKGYVFAGWKTASGEAVTASSVVRMAGAQLYAQWQQGAYAVRFLANGGSGSMDNQAFAYNVSQALTSNAFTRTDHAFAGWATNSTAEASFEDGAVVSNLTDVVGGTVSLYAKWVHDVCTLTFNANGGVLEGAASRKVKVGVAVGELPTATREGYALEGWKLADGTMVTAGTAFQGDTALTAVWTPASTQVPTPTISPGDGTEFTTASQTVTISCPVSGVAIYFTKNGTTPRTAAAYRYTGPFTVSGTATIMAVATADGMERSEYARATLTKVNAAGAALADALEAPGLEVTTGGGSAWTTTDFDGECARSGAVGANGSSWMETTVSGAGAFTFRWKVSCEEDEGGNVSWDRLVLQTNGVEAARIDGDSGWVTNTVTFADDGDHVIRWTYVKDSQDAAGKTGEDCGWVGGVSWVPEVVSSITYVGLEGALHMNPGTYVEGTAFEFAEPSARIGYTFAGWTPSGIMANTTGDVTATARWTATSGGGTESSSSVTTVVQQVAAPYALTDDVADRAIASVTVNSDCAIDAFVLKDGVVYDTMLRIVNTADSEVKLTLPTGYSYETFKGVKPLTIPAKSKSLLSITRVEDKTFLVSREDLEDVK
jgi:uncharacterized repeat protein (TIGR02543 family)